MKETKMKMMALDELRPYENNPRHNDAAVDAVAASIKEFGFKVPIIVDKDNIIVAGHTRLKAAYKLGLTEVPVIIADDLTDEQVKAFRIADNKVGELAEWDIEKLNEELAGLTIDMSMFGFEIEPEAEDDEFDVEEAIEEIQQEEPTSKPGDIYQLGGHRLMVGDSTDRDMVKALMNGERADCVVTDPPYNVAIENSQGMTIENDNMGSAEFKEFLTKAFKAMSDSLKPGGAFYVWYASREHLNFESALNAVGLTVRQQLIWVKNALVLGRQDYQWKHEPCLYGWKDGDSHYFVDDRTQETVVEDKPNINKMSKDQLKAYVKELLEDRVSTTVLKEDKPAKNTDHPTMKPLKLLSRQIKNSTKKQELVLDLFGGSGSTLIACEQLNRRCNMMEYDPVYADVIIKRWEKLTGRKAERIKDGK